MWHYDRSQLWVRLNEFHMDSQFLISMIIILVR